MDVAWALSDGIDGCNMEVLSDGIDGCLGVLSSRGSEYRLPRFIDIHCCNDL